MTDSRVAYTICSHKCRDVHCTNPCNALFSPSLTGVIISLSELCKAGVVMSLPPYSYKINPLSFRVVHLVALNQPLHPVSDRPSTDQQLDRPAHSQCVILDALIGPTSSWFSTRVRSSVRLDDVMASSVACKHCCTVAADSC
jgi:hypothetical protein